MNKMLIKIKGVIEKKHIVDIYYNKASKKYSYFFTDGDEWKVYGEFESKEDALTNIYSTFCQIYDKVTFPKFTKKELKKYGVKQDKNG